MSERRDVDRVPIALFLNEYVNDHLHRAVTTNVSPTGLYVHRVYAAGHRRLQFGRDHRFVQLEFALPGYSDTIWARGEVRYDDLSHDMVHGTGIRLVDMARGHFRQLRDYVLEKEKLGGYTKFSTGYVAIASTHRPELYWFS